MAKPGEEGQVFQELLEVSPLVPSLVCCRTVSLKSQKLLWEMEQLWEEIQIGTGAGGTGELGQYLRPWLLQVNVSDEFLDPPPNLFLGHRT